MSRSLSGAVLRLRPGVFAELQPRIDAAVASGRDLVPLHIGDTCAAAPPLGEDWTREGSLGAYGATTALSELRHAAAERLRSLGHGPSDVDPERHVLVGAGATHALACAARAVLSEGDEVLLLAPYWPLAHGIIAQAGAIPVEVPFTDRVDDPSFDITAQLSAACTDRTRALYLITPNNPDGKVLSAATLEQLAAFAIERDLWVFADEAYADWVYDGAHRSIAALPGMAARTVSAYSASKSHALAGARIGFALAAADVIAAARRVSVHTVFNVPVAMQRAALSALRAPPTWHDEIRARYREARDAMTGALRVAGLRFTIPEGGAYVFADFAPVLGGAPLTRLLEAAVEEGVLLTPGEAFGDAYRTWGRICFTSVPLERMALGVSRLCRAIEALAAG